MFTYKRVFLFLFLFTIPLVFGALGECETGSLGNETIALIEEIASLKDENKELKIAIKRIDERISTLENEITWKVCMYMI